MALPKLLTGQALYLAPVRLAAAAPADVRADIKTESGNEPRWIQIAEAGEYKGHPSGPFELTKEVFDELVGNFHRHPAFAPGVDGVGTARVIAFDFHHASEDMPAAVAVHGAPAQAWALDLQTRGSGATAQLWALTEYLEPMASYAKDGKYRWTSVAIWPDASDPKTGEPIGWYLSSIAFTNDPFIQGMTPVAAKRGLRMRSYYVDDYGPENLDEVLGAIKGILELPETATAPDIAGELGKLRAFAAAPDTAPAGVEVDKLVRNLRRLLNLPLLTGAEAVFVELEKVMAMAEAPQAQPSPTAPALPPVAAPAITTRNNMALLKVLAGRFGIPATETEVEAAVLAALDGGQQAQTALAKLMGLLGVKNMEGATSKLQELLGLKDLLPTIEALLQGEVEAEEANVDADVEAVVASYRVPEAMRYALRAARVGAVAKLAIDGCMVASAAGQSPLELRRAARKAFKEQYPAAFVSADKQHLLQPLATDAPKSPVLRALTNIGGGVGFAQPKAQAPAPGPGHRDGGESKVAAEVLRCAGRNHIEKAMNYLRAQPGGKDAPIEEIHERACLLSRELKLDRQRAV